MAFAGSGNMERQLFDRLVCNGIRTIALLSCAWCLAPASAWASCGDYVAWKGALAKMDSHAQVPRMADSVPRNHSNSHDVPVPCTGPMCSEGKQSPLFPAP